MLNCCTQDNSANYRSSFTFHNFDVDDNNHEIEKNNVNMNKEESKEEPVNVEKQNNTENIPAPSSGGFKRTKTKHFQ